MKISGVIKNLKIKKNFENGNSKNISRNVSGAVEGCVGSVSDSSLFQLILLKVYSPFPMPNQC